MHANSEIEETGPRFCRNSTSHVCQICCFKYNQINNYSFQVASSLLLFIILIVIGRNYIFLWQVTNTITLL